MLHKMYIEWLFGRMRKDEAGDGEKGEKQYSTSGSAIVWFLLFNGKKIPFHLLQDTKYCAL